MGVLNGGEAAGRKIPPSSLQMLIPQPAPRPPSINIEDHQKPAVIIDNQEKVADDDHHLLRIIRKQDLQILKEVGRGGYGSVYLGRWRGSEVAVKVANVHNVLAKRGKLQEVMESFWNEARILGRLNHPNIVGFYGVIMVSSRIIQATVSEYMTHGALSDLLTTKTSPALEWRTRISIARDVALGLEYLHANNVVHLDIKSDNIFVNMEDAEHPVCKIGDFGLSRMLNQKKLVYTGGRRIGTLYWMAPELLCGHQYVTEKLDVYSFGILMWEILTGELPYRNVDREVVKRSVATGKLRPEVPSWCDPQWKCIMERCWSPKPRDRPSFSEIASHLQNLLPRFSFGSLEVKPQLLRPEPVCRPPPLASSAIDEINKRIAQLPLGGHIALGCQDHRRSYQLFPQ